MNETCIRQNSAQADNVNPFNYVYYLEGDICTGKQNISLKKSEVHRTVRCGLRNSGKNCMYVRSVREKHKVKTK